MKALSNKKMKKNDMIDKFVIAFEKHCDDDIKNTKEVTSHIISLKERLDRMNGSVPFIKEKVIEMQTALLKMNDKIDQLHQMNSKQDIQIAKDSEVINWIRKILIYGFPSSVITIIIGLIFKKFIFHM